MADAGELQRMHTYAIVGADGGSRPSFVIDGRTYATPEAVRADIGEASDALNALLVDFERETTEISPAAPPSVLPGWRDIKRTYLDRLPSVP